MWPVIRRNVRAPDRDVEGSPATPRFPPVHASSGESGGVSPPRQGTAPTGHNSTAWTHCASYLSAVPRRWRGRCLTGCHRHRWSDDRRIPPARCPRAPQAREIPRPAPDACSAGTRTGRGAVQKVTAPPHFSAPRDRLSRRTRRLGNSLPRGHAGAVAAHSNVTAAGSR
jgi:hypothetical protein